MMKIDVYCLPSCTESSCRPAGVYRTSRASATKQTQNPSAGSEISAADTREIYMKYK